MGYQSEAQLEELLIRDIKSKGFEGVKIVDNDDLVKNFRKTLERFNKGKLNGIPFTDKEFERIMVHIEGKTVFESAKRLRDKYLLEREDGKDRKSVV